MSTEPKRPVGRPRQKPIGVQRRYLDLTPGEFAAVRRAAKRAQLSAAEWMRREIISASKAHKS